MRSAPRQLGGDQHLHDGCLGLAVKSPLVIDIEWAANTDDRVLSVSWMSTKPGDMDKGPQSDTRINPMLAAELADPCRPIVEHTKADARWAMMHGFPVNGPVYDTQVIAWVLNENQRLSLERLHKRYVGGPELDKRLRRSAGIVVFKCDDGTEVLIEDAPIDQLSKYNRGDVQGTADLFKNLWSRLESADWLDYYLDEEMPFTSVLLDVESRGLPIDLEASEKLRLRLEEQHERWDRGLHEKAGLPAAFNLNSGDHMAAFLYSKAFELKDSVSMSAETKALLKGMSKEEKLEAAREGCVPEGFEPGVVGREYIHGLWTLKGRRLRPTMRTDKGDRWSTSGPALRSSIEAMTDEWVTDYLGFKRIDKLLTTYLRKFPKIAVEVGAGEGGTSDLARRASTRIFGRFNQTGTKTGRLSSSDPNLQNIPARGDLGKEVRSLFKGDLIIGDFSQLEPRLMAHYSNDPFLVDVYTNEKDLYNEMAHNVFGTRVDEVSEDERGTMKVLVLAMGYGAMGPRVSLILTINGYPTDEDRAVEYLSILRTDMVPVFFDWREKVITKVKRVGYVQTIGGRHRRLKAAFKDRKNWKNIGYGERQAVNAMMQGSAGDIVRRAMVECSVFTETEELPVWLLLQVHDELGWEHRLDPKKDQGVIDALQTICETGHGFRLRVPLRFDPYWCHTWADKGTGIVLELPEDVVEETTDFEEAYA
jgi:DNA polymerase I-like protein with 3'-5' exonuclease and polymerase domains